MLVASIQWQFVSFSHLHDFAVKLRDKDLQRTAVMVLGAVASTLVETSHPETANQIVHKIEVALGVHGEIIYH